MGRESADSGCREGGLADVHKRGVAEDRLDVEDTSLRGLEVAARGRREVAAVDGDGRGERLRVHGGPFGGSGVHTVSTHLE